MTDRAMSSTSNNSRRGRKRSADEAFLNDHDGSEPPEKRRRLEDLTPEPSPAPEEPPETPADGAVAGPSGILPVNPRRLSPSPDDGAVAGPSGILPVNPRRLSPSPDDGAVAGPSGINAASLPEYPRRLSPSPDDGAVAGPSGINAASLPEYPRRLSPSPDDGAVAGPSGILPVNPRPLSPSPDDGAVAGPSGILPVNPRRLSPSPDDGAVAGPSGMNAAPLPVNPRPRLPYVPYENRAAPGPLRFRSIRRRAFYEDGDYPRRPSINPFAPVDRTPRPLSPSLYGLYENEALLAPRLVHPLPAHPAPVPVHPAPVPVHPAPVPVHPAPVPVHPAPVPVHPAPVPVHPAPVPVDPAPVPIDPGPGPVDPAPRPRRTFQLGVTPDARFNSRYEVFQEQVLGIGPTARVFSAVRRSDGQQVAVKCVRTIDLPPRDLRLTRHSMPGVPTPVYNEIGMMLEMQQIPPLSPHVIQMLDWFECPDGYIMVLEHLAEPWVTTRRYFSNNARMAERDVRNLSRQFVHGISHIIQRRVMYRSIRPECVLINRDTLQLKVCGFGRSDRIFLRDVEDHVDSRHRRHYIYEPKACHIILGSLCGSLEHLFQLTSAEFMSDPGLSNECKDFYSMCLRSFNLPLEQLLNHPWTSEEELTYPD